MSRKKYEQDPYIGKQPITDYYLTEKVGNGRIGSVYKAVKSKQPQDVLACKVIPEGKLKDGWDREIEKVIKLRGIRSVVPYHQHDTSLDNNNRPFAWILWDFIEGINLKDYIKKVPWPLDLPFIESIVKTILTVLHACRAVGIQHGDLHEGNILISKPDLRIPGNPRIIWVSDFGYGGSHNEIQPKDDYRQLFGIATSLLHKLTPSDLNPRDKVMYQKLEEFLSRKILEVDRTQGSYVGDPEKLIESYNKLGPEALHESSAASKGEEIRGPGDYLAAEAFGYRVNEWKNLFVPQFLAAQDLLSRNVTVLTGARGCGKTMAFRRLTAFMDNVIGEPSGVNGSDQFVGFYLNCRELAEAFPWLPKKLQIGMKEQIIHYFHLLWFSEICKTLAVFKTDYAESYDWLDKFIIGIFHDKYYRLPDGADIVDHVRAFIEDEKERCRVTILGRKRGPKAWPLSRMDFLEKLKNQLELSVPWIGQMPLFFFLDDYTIPIIPREVQQILNPIIFNRRSNLYFKISTEATNSFERQGMRGKPLELHQDFELIDLATESLHQPHKTKAILLENIFKPRIKRSSLFREKDFSLGDVLGKDPLSNNELAWQMRKRVQDSAGKRIYYYGKNAFVGMWASDIRIMIQMFTAMLRDANEDLKRGRIPIEKSVQDKIYRANGGEFLEFIKSVVDPSAAEGGPSSTKPGEQYGTHLKNIVESFVKVSRYELTESKLISNQGRMNPKQAFRVEIVDKFELTEEAERYYDGLIRWHIFLQDWRGKSVRGMITPRLYLNRILIPYCYLTFSSRDHIHLNNSEFNNLLTKPELFPNYWEQKRRQIEDKQKKIWD